MLSGLTYSELLEHLAVCERRNVETVNNLSLEDIVGCHSLTHAWTVSLSYGMESTVDNRPFSSITNYGLFFQHYKS